MMRHLNKTIFIQSADIDYLEIDMNGNVHFTGDQGVGKSTVLRAILFFYNARTDKLGINAGDESFFEFYLKYSNSHIIYEVQTEHNKFCVWLTKENNRPAYRFIDSAYDKDLFFEKTTTGLHSLQADEIKIKLRAKNIILPRKVFQFNDFRNIIYGASQENKFRPYSIMQSSAYQNVPNTITNIFLNAQLDSDKIKQTIINSLIGEELNKNKNKFQIDLSTIRKDINEFEQDFNDISDFDKTKRKAEKVISLSVEYNQKEQEKILTAQNIGESLLFFQNKIIEHENQYKKLDENLRKSEATIKTTKEEHKKTEKEIEDKIVIIKNDIKEAEKKQNYWKNVKVNDLLIGIENILHKISGEKELLNQKTAKTEELKTLKTAFESIEQKYKILFQQIENKKNTQINTLNNQFTELQSDAFLKKEKIVKYFTDKLDETDEIFEKNIKTFEDQKDFSKNLLENLKLKCNRIQTTDFFKEDIENYEKQITNLEKQTENNNNEIKIEKANIKNIQDKAQSEEELLQTKYDNKKQKLTEEYKNTEKKIKKITSELLSYDNSFYKFLHTNYKDWGHNIAKVCDKKILFSDNLKPKLIEKNDYFFGVELDLSEHENNVKTISEYEKDKQNLETKLHNTKHEIQILNSKFETDKTNFVKSRNRKINTLKTKIKQFEADNFKNQTLKSKAEISLDDFKQKTKEEKTKQLAEIQPKITDTEKQLNEIKKKIEQQKWTKQKQRQNLNIQKKERLVELDEKIKIAKTELDKNIKKAEKDYLLKKQNIEKEELNELAGSGANTEKIEILNRELANIDKKLNFIEKLKKNYTNLYEIEKQEIEKLPQLKDNKLKYETQLTELKQKHKNILDSLLSENNNIKTDFKSVEIYKNEINIDLEKYEDFENTEVYKNLSYYITKAEQIENQGKLSNIIDKLKDIIIEFDNISKKLKKQADEFVSPFRENNIFHFQKQFSDDTDYLNFAENLKEYIEEEKIEDVKQEVKKKHTGLIHYIVADINILASKRKLIDKTIADINRDFKNSNFVSVIQEFEIKTEDTGNKIVQVLYEIKNFHDDNPYNFGEENLFSGSNMEENNQKSIKLLTSLLKNLKTNTKQNIINLEDIFELKFRAMQNDKNTGWKTKLSDVGSHGTDILLKAMIYIMLLNVFKEKATKKSKIKEFKLHCLMDEIGRIHSKNIKNLIEFANNRDIWMIFGSPEENDALAYKYVYDFEKHGSITNATRLIYDKRN